MRATEIYQAGLLDSVRQRPSLLPVLVAAEEAELTFDYIEGLNVGDWLLSGEDDIVLGEAA
jgi:hypothetical protein